MGRHRWIACALACVLALGGRDAARADTRLLEEAIGLTGIAMFLDSGAPGMVLAVVRGPDILVRGYGETARGNGREPDERSLLRIGSISKAFAGELLAALAVEGRVRLTDPLRLHAAGAPVPRRDGREITLLDLATHSAGLPREMGEAPEGTAPFTWPTREDRWRWLRGFAPPWSPGTVAAYSNVGFGLLADALETAAGRPYAELLREQITGPLGMADTVPAPTAEQCARLMLGSGLGGPGPCVDTAATEGSGGLYSTGADMARWLRHNAAPAPEARSRLEVAHAAYRQRQGMAVAIGFDEGGPMAGIGLGWLTMAADGPRPLIVQKSGGGAGFMSYVAFAPGREAGVFVAVSRMDFAMFFALTGAANGLIANLVTR